MLGETTGSAKARLSRRPEVGTSDPVAPPTHTPVTLEWCGAGMEWEGTVFFFSVVIRRMICMSCLRNLTTGPIFIQPHCTRGKKQLFIVKRSAWKTCLKSARQPKCCKGHRNTHRALEENVRLAFFIPCGGQSYDTGPTLTFQWIKLFPQTVWQHQGF